MSKEKAIILAANLKGDYIPEIKDVGNVLTHASHIEKEGAVLWSIVPPGKGSVNSFHHPEIKKGYFYNVSEKKVNYIFDIKYIKIWDEIREKKKDYKFLIDSRKYIWKDKDLREKFYWMKIIGIYRLKKDHEIQNFKKVSNNKPLKLLRNYSIVIDPNFQHYDKKITGREIMSDYIGDLLIRGTITEKDIEELFSYRLADKLSLVERQGAFRKAGRLDLLYKNHLGHYILYEFKKGIAKSPTLKQIKRYMKASIKKHKINPENIKGIILAKNIDPELYKLLDNESNIEAKTYFFSIELK